VSDIRQIDAAFHAQRAVTERSSAQDFAHELAKTGADKTGDNAHAHDHAAVNQPVRTVAIAPKPSVNVSHASLRAPAVAASDVATQEQLNVAVQPTGITEALPGSRVYGVHLLASTYLSELATRGEPDTEVIPATTLPSMADTLSPPHAVISEVPPNLSSTPQSAPLHEEVVAVLSLLVNREVSGATSHTPSSTSVSIASMEASTMLWPESSLRLTKQRDGSAVIWLRDYRMPNEGASQVMDLLTKGAEAAGIRLGRIILNGREVWTSPNNY
jgi:hypothetical protein